MTEFDALALAVVGVRGIKPYRPGKPIDEVEREYGISNPIKLASNENPRGAPPGARRALQNITELGRYPDGNARALKIKIASRLGVDIQQITMGNGSNDVLELVARVFAGPGDEIIYSAHAFAVYGLVTRAVGAKSIVVDARRWGHDLDAMADAVTNRTRVVFIANPNNPTGTWSEARALRRFLGVMPTTTVVVVDEAYCEYVGDSAYPDCVRWLRDFPNLIVTRTFSKVYGLAALRVGYGISSSAVADLLNRVRQPFNVNSVAQYAAIAALDDTEFVAASIAENHNERQRLYVELSKQGLGYIPSGGNFVSVDVKRPAVEVYENMLRRGVIVRPIGEYGMPNHLRITVGVGEENTAMLNVLSQCLQAT
ncbi:MAG: histidinol-phosphate transaminase [Gammaproteobacteria bacterium]|nr:histidinol-phosphate transaminase [Gammaproteobacteria bacterium]MDH3467597.1 histidinol-phosphate transaminase [Gammaproteobacteria bacterium]